MHSSPAPEAQRVEQAARGLLSGIGRLSRALFQAGEFGIAAAAWFGMMGIMAFAPLGLAGCGLGLDATVGAVAWHLVAMYAPVLFLGAALDKAGEKSVAAAGLGLIILAAFASFAGHSASAIIIALIAAGAGWSIATTAAVAALHRNAPSRVGIATHDATILLAGVGGALAAQFMG